MHWNLNSKPETPNPKPQTRGLVEYLFDKYLWSLWCCYRGLVKYLLDKYLWSLWCCYMGMVKYLWCKY